ncbi:transcription/translation regulatory transformer protein RfaH [Xenorhabdus szentirmaii]|uniref:Transcription antitermination protein RfaH n=2 Tax=Xenorhabdus szentirmaii TaxID=290112 RepID=W1IT89_9GAMM|nr:MULTISPECIES: transcription/translation regulatory transformer protein RfaH [Xenorhabdus]MBD2781977.1 transcription/translation regulatory transformer protein RfaH [Xenorhabdus sp. 38]MBD2791117.1 transcription/translation regulatory transformer protein RfaH [Xenorhabdus sp. CUL]MBD2799587.1 transcription/translation regulatory transformer protein RfaH [Xenorhabdus sp. M]MBD2806809.1 transcription/translation regulatory transformer protein RfaH [Xenorhabdus sp. ZM]MBD2821022.1 transcription
MGNWYLLYCKRGQISRAIENLERQNVICLTPIAKIEKVVRGKRTTISEPLFPNYLFVNFDPEVIHTTTVNSTRGVNHFIRFSTYPAVVPQTLIDELMSVTEQKYVDPETPVTGDTVLITEGIFEGIKAIYNEPDGETRSILLLNILNKEVSKALDNNQFTKI